MKRLFVSVVFAGGCLILMGNDARAVLTETITLNSGAGLHPNDPVPNITNVSGSQDEPLSVDAFDDGDFTAARSGPQSYVVNTAGIPWIPSLTGSADDARWINWAPEHGDPSTNGSPASALYAMKFHIEGIAPTSATITFQWAADDRLGDNTFGIQNPAGLYINGVPVPGIAGGGRTAETSATAIIDPAILVGGPGTGNANTLYVYNRDLQHHYSGVIFHAEIVVTSSGPPICPGCADGTHACCIDPPSGMVGWWPLDETSGGLARDIAWGNNGTINGAAPSAGRVSGGRFFDGINDSIDVPDHPVLNDDCEENLSVQAWVKVVDPAPGANGTIVEKQGKYALGLEGNQLAFEIIPNQVGLDIVAYADPGFVLPDGCWHHVAVTIDRPNGIGRFYIDGSPAGTFTFLGPNAYSGPLSIGSGGRWGNFHGNIDEVEIYDRALLPEEITALVSAGVGGHCKCNNLTPNNMLRNGGFECGLGPACTNGGLGTLDDWVEDTNQPDWVGTRTGDCNSDNDVNTTTEAWNGDRFVFLKGIAFGPANNEEAVGSDFSSSLALEAGAQYHLSFWGAQKPTIFGVRGSVRISFDGTDQKWSRKRWDAKISESQGDWGYYDKVFKANSETGATHLTLRENRGNSVTLDGVNLERVDDNGCPCNLIPNDSFEHWVGITECTFASLYNWYTVYEPSNEPILLTGPDCPSQAGLSASSASEGVKWVSLDNIKQSDHAIGVPLIEPLVPNKRYRLTFDAVTGQVNRPRTTEFSTFLATTVIAANGNKAQGWEFGSFKIRGKKDDWQHQELVFTADQAYTNFALQNKARYLLGVDNFCLVPYPSPDPSPIGGGRQIVGADAGADSAADTNYDGVVDLADFAAFRSAFGRSVGHPDYNEDADFDDDGTVTLDDYEVWFDDYLDSLIVNPIDDLEDVVEPTVVVWFEPSNVVAAPGSDFQVNLVAHIAAEEPIVGWGLDVGPLSLGVVTMQGQPTIGPAWTSVNAFDGDGLAAVAFPNLVSGPGIVLATLNLHADQPGSTRLDAIITPGDLAEGFALAQTGFARLVSNSVTICVPSTSSDATCNGIDDDCDGFVDEDAIAACDDGNPCTIDSCDPAGGGACISSPVNCNDNNACTDDSCNPATGCVYTNNTNPCDDGNPCTNDACSSGVCAGSPVPDPAVINDSVRVDKTPSNATITWTDPPGSYDVYRGSKAANATFSYNLTCLSSNVIGNASHDTDPPLPNQLFYYLVARVDTCNESSLGANSAGAERPTLHACSIPVDLDGDGVSDIVDNCPTTANPSQADVDHDGIGDACDDCVTDSNPDQSDLDNDGQGDACDPDIDGDGILNGADNCIYIFNPGQADANNNGIGDSCEPSRVLRPGSKPLASGRG